jgi:hypothetical protein
LQLNFFSKTLLLGRALISFSARKLIIKIKVGKKLSLKNVAQKLLKGINHLEELNLNQQFFVKVSLEIKSDLLNYVVFLALFQDVRLFRVANENVFYFFA